MCAPSADWSRGFSLELRPLSSHRRTNPHTLWWAACLQAALALGSRFALPASSPRLLASSARLHRAFALQHPPPKSQNHRLEKTSEIIKSNHQPSTTTPAKSYPKVPHLHVFLNVSRDGDSKVTLKDGSASNQLPSMSQFPKSTCAGPSWRA